MFKASCKTWENLRIIACVNVSMPLWAKEYHKRIVSAAGKSGWQGGKHLALTAVWTREFCMGLMHCWLKACVLCRTEGRWCSANGCMCAKWTSKWSSPVDVICFARTCTFSILQQKGKNVLKDVGRRLCANSRIHAFHSLIQNIGSYSIVLQFYPTESSLIHFLDRVLDDVWW